MSAVRKAAQIEPDRQEFIIVSPYVLGLILDNVESNLKEPTNDLQWRHGVDAANSVNATVSSPL
jgi:hypothetical protein